MAANKPLILLIDGNNLAHYLFHLPNRKLGEKEADLMMTHLASYARQAQPPVEIILCLDPLPLDFNLPVKKGLRKPLVAEYPERADDVVIQRFRYHHHNGDQCLVITNDNEVSDTIFEENGSYLLVSHFVLRSGSNPVFLSPADLPKPRITGQRTKPETASSGVSLASFLERSKTNQKDRAKTARRKYFTQASPVEVPPQHNPISSAVPVEPPAPQPQPITVEPFYRLTLEKWPLESGLRFLLDSFCAQHGLEYQELRSLHAEDLQPQDLVEVAQVLVQACGNEPEFCRRGALMVRIRLALLLAGDRAVSLTELAELTGMKKEGLQGRIREKAGNWLEIIHPSES